MTKFAPRSAATLLKTSACSALIAAALTACTATENTQSPAKATSAAQNATAKNIIIFIGDGMGVSTVTAARIFDGQSQGKKGEEHVLAFEDFDNVALIKTYNTNAQVPDSAGTATAILSGYKTSIGTVNVPAEFVAQRSPEACNPDALPPNLTTKAHKVGKSVGVISTARITHATPAAMYGHSADRGWEADRDITPIYAGAGCKSLAWQMVESQAEVILGGGAKEFTEAQIEALKADFIYVENKTDMMAAPSDKKLRGLFTASHMSFEADRDPAVEPSLADMTSAAIDRLSSDADGFVLMVEAGRVDHAHHGTNAYRALTDMQALNEAVKIAKAKTGNDTLIMVTADHSHVFTMAGYPVRGNPILGLVKGYNPETREVELIPDQDGKPYTTLGYHNGSNVREADSPALTDNMVQAKDYRQQTAVNLGSETHAGEDVPLYARGPGAEKVRGVMEQDEIGQLIAEVLGAE